MDCPLKFVSVYLSDWKNDTVEKNTFRMLMG